MEENVMKTLIRVKVADLIPYERNPRKIPQEAVDAVKESYRQCGVIDPIEIDEKNVILSGHTRRLAAIEKNILEVDALRVTGLTEEQKRKYRVLANKTGEKSGWDYDLLAVEIEDLDFEEFDFGWDLPPDAEREAEEDNFDVKLPKVAKSKPGEVYQLGRHRLMCGSSTDPQQVKTLMGGSLTDLLLTDPPYGVDYVGGTGMMIENDNLAGDEFLQFLRDAFDAADQVMKPGAAFYIWHADSNGAIFRNACSLVGWKVRQCLIWVKNTIVMGRQDYQWKHEPCLYGWKGGAAHDWENDRKQTTVLEYDKPLKSELHPTMKPVPLFDYQMKNNTKAGAIVLDLFAGSGTTIIAAEQNGRCAYCMELDPKYCDVIIDRWESFTGEKAERINESGEVL